MFVYVAFVIDAYAGAIVGWEGSTSKQTRFVESAIRQAAALRSRQGHPIDGAIHHSVGDAFDNALAETTIGLYKNECVRVPPAEAEARYYAQHVSYQPARSQNPERA